MTAILWKELHVTISHKKESIPGYCHAPQSHTNKGYPHAQEACIQSIASRDRAKKHIHMTGTIPSQLVTDESYHEFNWLTPTLLGGVDDSFYVQVKGAALDVSNLQGLRS